MSRKSHKTKIAGEHFTWILFVRDGIYYADGRAAGLKKHSLGTRDYDEALKNLRRLDTKIAIERGLCVKPAETKGDQLTIAQGWAKFLDHRGRPPVMGGVVGSTLKRYRTIRDHHLEFCALRRIDYWPQVDKASTEEYGRWRSPNAADTTLKTELDVLVTALNYLVKEAKLLPRSQLFSLGLKSFEDSDRYCFQREEVTAMIEHCRTTPGLEWFGDVIIAFATTGLRNSTMCGLRWREIDLAAGVIRIRDERHDCRKKGGERARTMKGKRHHCLPINPQLRSVLERLPRTKDGLVFHNPEGDRLNPEYTLDTLKDEVLAPLKDRFPAPPGGVGFEHAVIHGFRHFFCSESCRQDISDAQILDWIGDLDSRLLRRYRHLRPDDSKAKMNKINFFDGGSLPSAP